MSDTSQNQIHLEYCTLGPGNTYKVYAGPIPQAFAEAIRDLGERNFPNFNATGTIHYMDVDLPFSLQDSAQMILTRYRAEMDEIARLYGNDV